MVCVGAFVLVVSLALTSVQTFGAGPPKPAPSSADDDPFYGPPEVANSAKSSGRNTAPLKKAQPKKDADSIVDPFGGASEAARPPEANLKQTKPSMPLSVAKPKPKTAPKLHGGEKAILKALTKKVSLHFVETPLKDVADYLSNKCRIPIILDSAGLKDAVVEDSTPITCKLSGISLQSALEIILDELQLKWTIHHDVLMITSVQKAESDDFLCTRFYDVTDLVNPIPDTSIHGTPLSTPDALHLDMTVREKATNQAQPAPGYKRRPVIMGPVPVVGMAAASPPAVSAVIGVPGYSMSNSNSTPPAQTQGADFQPLIDLIEEKVAEKSWTENGGNGTIEEMPPGDLVISQTRKVHQEIARFLATLRRRERTVAEFRVELRWLWLDGAHRDALLTTRKQAANEIDPRRLLQVAGEVPSFHASTDCMNGQAGTVVAGDRRSLIVDAIPAGDGGTAYQPIVSMPNVGVIANVQPILLRSSNMARLIVRATITRWTPARIPAVVGAAWPEGSRASLDVTPAPANSSTTNGTGPPPAQFRPGFGGGFFQVASENAKTATSVTASSAPSTTPPTVPPSAGKPQTMPQQSSSSGSPQEKSTQPSPTISQSSASISAHGTMSSHGAGYTSCPIDLPVMPTQEFSTTLRVPLGKPVVVGSVTFAPEGDAGLGAAKEDSVEVYLIATTSVVEKAK